MSGLEHSSKWVAGILEGKVLPSPNYEVREVKRTALARRTIAAMDGGQLSQLVNELTFAYHYHLIAKQCIGDAFVSIKSKPVIVPGGDKDRYDRRDELIDLGAYHMRMARLIRYSPLYDEAREQMRQKLDIGEMEDDWVGWFWGKHRVVSTNDLRNATEYLIAADRRYIIPGIHDKLPVTDEGVIKSKKPVLEKYGIQSTFTSDRDLVSAFLKRWKLTANNTVVSRVPVALSLSI
jgi:hypothetical protein